MLARSCPILRAVELPRYGQHLVRDGTQIEIDYAIGLLIETFGESSTTVSVRISTSDLVSARTGCASAGSRYGRAYVVALWTSRKPAAKYADVEAA